MLSLALPRALVISTLTLAVSLATETARAEQPQPSAAPAAPTAAAPMALAAPPPASPPPLGYANADDPPDVEYLPETRIRSSGLLAGGVLLLSLGLVGVVAGSSMIGAHEPTRDPNDIPPCFDDTGSGCGGIPAFSSEVVLKPGMRTAGIATLIGSAVSMGVGIPLIVLGAKRVPVLDDDAARAAKLTPTLRVGSSGATLTWQF